MKKYKIANGDYECTECGTITNFKKCHYPICSTCQSRRVEPLHTEEPE